MKPVLVCALALCASLTLASPALACKCAVQTVEQAKQDAAAIFEGRVTSIEDVASAGQPGITDKRVTFALVRVWKELENVETVSLVTRASTASCGYPFEKDASYLVYAGREDAGFTASTCSRTRPMAEAAEDLAALGGGVTPVKVEPKPAAAKPEAKPAADKGGGCNKGKQQGQASLWLAAPALALVLRRRRKP